MRFTRGIIFGFMVGTLIGLLIYLRLRRDRATVRESRYMRIHLPHRPAEPETGPAAPPSPPPTSGVLEDIQGIGRVRADRLRAGGLETLADLAAATPEKVQALLGSRVSLATAAAFIAEAQKLS